MTTGRTVLALAVLLCVAATAGRAQVTAREVLERLDASMTIRTLRMRAELIVHYREGDDRTMTFESWERGTDQAFLEFISPARDAGSRFLRLGDAMWIYLPRVGKSVRIQGHMLRQGFMGSDFSYGDASENPSMVNDYDAVIERRDTVDGRPTIVLSLSARRPNLSYPRRRTWVDTERWVPLREELFAASGRLLKTIVLSDVRRLADRWYPFRIELDDALQTETTTTFRVLEMRLNVTVPAGVFTVRYLESGR
jgi:outer membrane lipoprotein-sorting protein